MARETLAYTQGSGTGSRTEEWRDPEPPGDGQPEAAPIPDIESEDEGLSRLGRFVPRSALPGDREKLIAGARRMHATDDVLDQLAQLEPGLEYATVSEVWAALGHSLDRVHR